jgi:hypothetical protein
MQLVLWLLLLNRKRSVPVIGEVLHGVGIIIITSTALLS